MKIDFTFAYYFSMISFALVFLFTSKTFETKVLNGNEQVAGIFVGIAIFLFFASYIIRHLCKGPNCLTIKYM